MLGAATHIRWLVPAFILAAALATAPSTAAAAACPSADIGHLSNCGPMYSVPTWTDAGGWDDPSQYGTIQLADVNGDGAEELIGRGDAGVVIYWFDTALGQWRPQAGPDGTPWILTDFASKPPWDEGDPTNPANAQYSSTIQAADIDGRPGAEILGRLAGGMTVYQYTPVGDRVADGGTWKRIGQGGPFSDADGYGDPSLYSTIQVGHFRAGDRPLLFARQHDGGDPDVASLRFYRWQDGAWADGISEDVESVYGFRDRECGRPSCYLTLQTARVQPPYPGDESGRLDEILGRGLPANVDGVELWDQGSGGSWSPRLSLRPGESAPDDDNADPLFADVPSSDCPFSKTGASGAGSGDCLGSSPSYYETLQAADVDGDGREEVLARASDGLRVYQWMADPIRPDLGVYKPLATLTALAGAPGQLQLGEWGSIRTADINGDRAEEVLHLGPTGLRTWRYNSLTDVWSLDPSTIGLAADPWLTHPEYYSTLQTGDVDGDGAHDVLVRGPYGIRTFFYDRRGTGGWERYLPEGYPDFEGGQANAYAALNADFGVTSIRSRWTQATEPHADDLLSLQNSLGTTCTGKADGDFPRYASCTPPGTPANYTADDWTTVINQLLAEVYYARQTTEWFGDIGKLKDELFIQQNARLPAIDDDLALHVAAGSSASFDGQAMWGGGIGIAASVVGLIPEVGSELSAALWVTSEAISMLPATSETASSTFTSTYAGLQAKYADMVSEAENGRKAQSQQARSDAGLAALVGQLRARGTWSLDTTAMTGAANQGFAAWVYAALMPTIYARYDINGCRDYGVGFVPAGGINSGYSLDCVSAPNQVGVHYQDSQTFIGTGEAFSQDNYPCYRVYDKLACAYDRTPDIGLSTKVWGPLADGCTNKPNTPSQQWMFSKCNVAVDLRTSVTDNGWNYTSYSGSPDPPGAFDCMIKNGCAVGSQARLAAPVRLRKQATGRRRAADGGARLEARLMLPTGTRLAGATVKVQRVLFERGHRDLTARRTSPRAKAMKLRLKRTGDGRFTAGSTGRRHVRVGLQRRPNGHVRLTLSARRLFHAPRACHAWPASVARDAPPLWLHSSLVIAGQRVRLHHHLRCRRDAKGNVSRLVAVRHPARTHRPGLDVSLRGPRTVEPGTQVRYVARVRNRRHTGGDRMASSLWDVRVGAGERRVRIRELPAGKARRIRFSLTVPERAQGRICAQAAAGAPGARADHDTVCSRVR
jgi:hypothetical protein